MMAEIRPDGDFEAACATASRPEGDGDHRRAADSVTPGIVEIEMDYAEALTQQHGFLHAGVISTALDSACGYAAHPDTVLIVDFGSRSPS
jgi:hypothetical protein